MRNKTQLESWNTRLGTMYNGAKTAGIGTTFSNSVLKPGEKIVRFSNRHSVPLSQEEWKEIQEQIDGKGVFIVINKESDHCSGILLKYNMPNVAFFLLKKEKRNGVDGVKISLNDERSSNTPLFNGDGMFAGEFLSEINQALVHHLSGPFLPEEENKFLEITMKELLLIVA